MSDAPDIKSITSSEYPLTRLCDCGKLPSVKILNPIAIDAPVFRTRKSRTGSIQFPHSAGALFCEV